MDATNREMENLKVAFDIIEDRDKIPVDYNKAPCHLVVDARMTLERKVRCLKDVHMNPQPEWSTFTGVCIYGECSHCVDVCCSKRLAYLRL